MYCVDDLRLFLRLSMQVVITLSSVVSSLKMDATKILEEMDQFKELWNQVTLSFDVTYITTAFFTQTQNKMKSNDVWQITRVTVTTKATTITAKRI